MKNFKKILFLILALTIAFSLFACGGKERCANDACTDKDGDNICDVCKLEMPKIEIQDVILIEDGEPLFQFVLAESLPAEARNLIQSTIVRTIKKDFDIEIPVSTEGRADDEEEEIEVLVGDVKSRGDKYFIDRYSLGKKGYVIKIVDSKIIINAGSDEKLLEAIEIFAEDILGYEEDDMDNVTMTADDIIEDIQDDYKIKSFKINGNDLKDYTIAVDSSNKLYSDAAVTLRDSIYSTTGKWLQIVGLDKADKSIVIKNVPKVYGSESFKTSVADSKLMVECAFDNKLNDALAQLITKLFTKGEGDVDLKGTVYTQDISVVYYEDFGAKGNGKNDDFAAIYKAHNFANEGGQRVQAKKNAQYLIVDSSMGGTTENDVKTISIKTPTDWTGAEFIIDDREIDYLESKHQSKMAGTNIFTIESYYDKIVYNANSSDPKKAAEAQAIIDKIGQVGRGTTKINIDLDYPAMLIIYNNTHDIYRRSGSSYVNTATGTNQASAQHELILIDKDGNVDPSTPFMFDYSTITSLEIIRTDLEELRVTGGTVTTRACQKDCLYVNEAGNEKQFGYYLRGIEVNRSNTVIEGVKHFVTDEITLEKQKEGIEGVHYRGFFFGLEASNVKFLKCQVQGRRYYGVSGTYDLGGNLVNNITFEECDQVNFWLDDGQLSMKWNTVGYKENGDPIKVRNCWGVGGTNFCKNMNYIKSRLSRFDAHCGLYNGKVIDCDLTFFAITGNGTFEVRNTRWFSAGEGSTDNSLIYMRGDYGSTWEGDVILDNVTAYASPGAFYMFMHAYNNWDYGYKCWIPNIEVNNFSLYDIASYDAKTDTTLENSVKNNIDITFFYGAKDIYMHRDQTYSAGPKVIDIVDYEKDENGDYVLKDGQKVPIYGLVTKSTNENQNPIGMPTEIKITGNKNNYSFVFVKNEDPNFYFAQTKFRYGTGENDYYLGTNHDDTQVFKFR